MCGASIHGRPEFGYTETDVTGKYTMVVSGGERYTVDFEHPAFLPAQRTAKPIWGEIAWTDDLALVPASAPSTNVQSFSPAYQEIVGEVEVDSDGARRPLVLIPPRTTITLERANAGSLQLSNADISIVEFTVGDDGPAAMPGELPQATAYTYAAAFRVAQAEPDDTVRFNRPVSVYLDNFLGFPVGGQIPVGFYNRELGAWSAERNGIVLMIVGPRFQFGPQPAAIDITGDGVAESAMELAAIGLTQEERIKILEHYDVGDSLWRVQLDHFSSHDFNPGLNPTAGAQHPQNNPHYADLDDGPCLQSGSIIECNNQALREAIPVTGTSIGLHYSSAHMHGRSDHSNLGDSANRGGSATKLPRGGHNDPCRWAGASSRATPADIEPVDDLHLGWQQRLGESGPRQTNRDGSNRLPISAAVYSATSYTFGSAAIDLWPPVDGNVRLSKDGASFIFSTLDQALDWWPHQSARQLDRRLDALGASSPRSQRATDLLWRWNSPNRVKRSSLSHSTGYRSCSQRPLRGLRSSRRQTAASTTARALRSFVAIAMVPSSSTREVMQAADHVSGDTSDPLAYGFGLKSTNGSVAAGIADMTFGPDGSLFVLSAGRLAKISPQGNVVLLGSEPDICGAIPPGVVDLTPAGIAENFQGVAVDSQSNVFLWHGLGVEQIDETGAIRDIDFRCSAGLISDRRPCHQLRRPTGSRVQ